MKKFKFLALPVATVASSYLLGLAFINGIDKQISSECSINSTYDYCVMFYEANHAESQQVEQDDQQVLIASLK